MKKLIIIIITILVIPLSLFGYYFAKINLQAFLLTDLSNEQIEIIEKEFSIDITKGIEVRKVYYKNPDYSLTLEILVKDQSAFLDNINFEYTDFHEGELNSVNHNSNISIEYKDNGIVVINKPFPINNEQLSDMIKENWSFSNYVKLIFS